jgi:hypothetical protein
MMQPEAKKFHYYYRIKEARRGLKQVKEGMDKELSPSSLQDIDLIIELAKTIRMKSLNHQVKKDIDEF